MSVVLPILGLIVLAAITIAGVTFAWRRGVSFLRVILEIIAVFLGGILALFPCACLALAHGLNSGPFGRTPAWLDVIPVVASAVGAIVALCLVSPPGRRGLLPAVAAALVGFAAAAGASFGASLLMQNSWCDNWLLLLAPLSIASATVGSYALALGGH